MDEPLPEVRVGDRERREVDDRLRKALAEGRLTLAEYEERAARCWEARTVGELDVLTADLPAPAPEPVTVALTSPAARPTPAAPDPAPAPGVVRRVTGGLIGAAIAAGVVFLGAGIVRAPDGASVFSSNVVRVGDDQDRVELGVLFGSIEVVVPDDVSVRPAGTFLFGSMDCEQACSGGAGGREVVVQAGGAFGSVEVVRESERRGDRDD